MRMPTPLKASIGLSKSTITSYFSNNYLHKYVNLVNPIKLINLEYNDLFFLLLLNSDYSVTYFRD